MNAYSGQDKTPSLIPVAVGMSHHRAPVAVRERLAAALSGDEPTDRFSELRDAVILATCSRFGEASSRD